MGFTLVKRRDVANSNTIRVKQKVWVKDGQGYPDGSAPNGAQLFCVPGDMLTMQKASQYGLIDNDPKESPKDKVEDAATANVVGNSGVVDEPDAVEEEDVLTKEFAGAETKERQPSETKVVYPNETKQKRAALKKKKKR